MTNPIQWGEKHNNIIEALTVLSKVKKDNKIWIIEKSTLQIAIEDRSLESTSRFLNGDGCEATEKIIDRIMRKGILLAYSLENDLTFRTKKEHNFQPINQKNNELLEQKLHFLRDLLKNALWGMSYIRDVYKSKVEGEAETALELTEKIDFFSHNILSLFPANDKPRLPDFEEGIEPPTSPTPYQTITKTVTPYYIKTGSYFATWVRTVNKVGRLIGIIS
jgi:hypothetical protein